MTVTSICSNSPAALARIPIFGFAGYNRRRGRRPRFNRVSLHHTLLRLYQVSNGDPFFEGQSSRYGTRAGRRVFQFAFARQAGPTPKPCLPKAENTQAAWRPMIGSAASTARIGWIRYH